MQGSRLFVFYAHRQSGKQHQAPIDPQLQLRTATQAQAKSNAAKAEAAFLAVQAKAEQARGVEKKNPAH
jgi:hypothetical protein